MALFEAEPVIVEFFPLLVTIPAVVTFIVMAAVSHWSSTTENPTLPIKGKHMKVVVVASLVVPLTTMFISGIIGYTFHNYTAAAVSYLSLLVLHSVVIVLIGIFAGLILAALYAGIGVSAFMLGALLMCAVPLATVATNSAGLWIGATVDFFYLPVIFLLVQSGCQLRFLQGPLGKAKPTERSISQTMSHMAGMYVLESVRVLRERAESDNDTVAQEALEKVLQTGGRVGDFIRETIQRGTALLQPADGLYKTTGMRGLLLFTPRGHWTMTNSRFRRRVWINRSLFVLLAATMILLPLNFPSGFSTQLVQWGSILFYAILGVSLPLAVSDPLLIGERADVERTVHEVLGPLRGIESRLLIGTEVSAPTTPYAVDRATATDQDRPAGAMLTSDFIEHQEPGLQSFLNAVVEGRDNVYEEGGRPLYIATAGAFVGTPAVVLAILSAPSLELFSNVVLILLACIGFLTVFIGLGWWYSLMRHTSFRGCRRSWLSIALSYLDARGAGITDVGMFLLFPRPSRQFVFLQTAGPTTSRALLRKLHLTTGQVLQSSVEREAAEAEMAVIRPLLVVMPLALVLLSVLAFLTPQSVPIVILFALSCVLLLYGCLKTRMNLKRARSEPPVQASAGPPETVTEVLRLMGNEYAYPLRLLTVREHGELMYTGRVFLTSTEVQFREAVFIPSIAR